MTVLGAYGSWNNLTEEGVCSMGGGGAEIPPWIIKTTRQE